MPTRVSNTSLLSRCALDLGRIPTPPRACGADVWPVSSAASTSSGLRPNSSAASAATLQLTGNRLALRWWDSVGLLAPGHAFSLSLLSLSVPVMLMLFPYTDDGAVGTPDDSVSANGSSVRLAEEADSADGVRRSDGNGLGSGDGAADNTPLSFALPGDLNATESRTRAVSLALSWRWERRRDTTHPRRLDGP